jgi:hypothetical protein
MWEMSANLCSMRAHGFPHLFTSSFLQVSCYPINKQNPLHDVFLGHNENAMHSHESMRPLVPTLRWETYELVHWYILKAILECGFRMWFPLLAFLDAPFNHQGISILFLRKQFLPLLLHRDPRGSCLVQVLFGSF